MPTTYTAVRSVVDSAALTWAADLVKGGVRPYALVSLEIDGDQSTSEFYLAIGDDDSVKGSISGARVYVLTRSAYASYTSYVYDVDYFLYQDGGYVVYSSFPDTPHLREEVTCDAGFARFAFGFGGLLCALLLVDGCKLIRARLGG